MRVLRQDETRRDEAGDRRTRDLIPGNRQETKTYHKHADAPANRLNRSSEYLEKSWCMTISVFGWLSTSMDTARRVRMTSLVMRGSARHWRTISLPTRPVAPVTMTFMVSELFLFVGLGGVFQFPVSSFQGCCLGRNHEQKSCAVPVPRVNSLNPGPRRERLRRQFSGLAVWF